MPREIIVIIEDPIDKPPERWLDLLWEELQALLKSRDLKLKDLKEKTDGQ